MPTKLIAFCRARSLRLSLLFIVLGLCLMLPVWLKPSSALTNGGSITSLGVPLTENFDTLAQSGTGIVWTDNTTIPGWFANRTSYNSGTGSATTGALYSLGVAGANAVSDRALGSLASSGTGTVYHAARLVNNTGNTINALNISFVGEQWRNGGSGTANTLAFQYQVASAGTITGANVPTVGWVSFTSLDFVSPLATGTAAALDGNAAANRMARAATLNVTVNAGQEIWLRWQDTDDAGSDHALAIDDFSVTATGTTPTPTPTPTPPPVVDGVVISQVYGGGGNSGATLKNDFIELFNRSATAVNLSGWSVQYATATAATWSVTPLTGITLQPGQYYLIQQAAGTGGTVDLPTPDASGTINLAGTSGKVALVSNTTALTVTCPTGAPVLDFIGYSSANCFEGSAAAPTLSNTTAALRGNNGCQDTNDNAADFTEGTPNPRNTATAVQSCATISATTAANPSTVQGGQSTTLTVNVIPATNPASTGLAVVANLSVIGGAASQAFSGNGNVFTFVATVAPGTSVGLKSLPVVVSDAQGRVFNTNILLSVQSTAAPNHLVISQVYGGGGNTGATFTHDYVELFNPTASAVTLTGWSIQYASATSTTWANKQTIGGIIGPGEYFLITLGSGGAIGAPLPVAGNIVGDLNLSSSAGKVALVNNSELLTGGACPLGIDLDVVDFVGFGTTANCREGTAPAPAPSSSLALYRQNGGATDNDQNSSDFTTATPAPRRTAPIMELGPWVDANSPFSGGGNVPYDGTVTLDFSEPVDVVGAWFNISCSVSGAHNNATVATYNNAKGFHVTPNTSFQFGETCTVTILKNQVRDQDTDDSAPDTDTLLADFVWSFNVVAAGAAAPYQPSEHLALGNPSGAVTSLSEPNNYLMTKPSFALSYNRDKGIPNWVSWHLEPAWFGVLTRFDTFRPDPMVPSAWYRVQATDYFASGFDRGHMTPNADRDNENRIPINQETYLMTNMVPQSPDNNQGPWAEFESYLRAELPLNGGQEMYVISGTHGVGGTGANGGTTTTLANGNITVPSHTWKVVVVLPLGENDLTRAACATRTIAILMPNTQGIRTNPWQNYLTTVDAIETLTGYNFFANLPEAVQSCIEAGTDGVNPPGTANQSASTAEDASVNVMLRALLPNANTPTFTIVSNPTNGTLGTIGAVSCNSGDCTASVTYTPTGEYNGADSFTFKANDGTRDSNTSAVSLTITAVNDPPTAANDAKSTNQNVLLSFPASDLTANDSRGPANESSQTLTVTSVTAGTGGTVALNAGLVTFTPTTNFSGAASFTYQVCDNGTTNGTADSKCAVATVNVTVVPVADTIPPTISCPANLTADFNVAVNGAIVTYTPPVGTDNLPGAVTTQIAGLASGATYPAGITTNTFRVTDAAGNTATCSFKVYVVLTALQGSTTATLGGQSYADSYTSTGGYPASKTSLAEVFSNGSVSLSTSGKVWGNVRSTRVGVSLAGTSQVTGNATAGTTVTKATNAIIGGTITNNALVPSITLPAVSACSTFSPNTGISGTYTYSAMTGNLSLSGTNIATLAPGTYCFNNLTLTNSAQLRVSGPVTIKLRGTLTMSLTSSLNANVPTPGNLRIVSSFSGATGVTIRDNATAYALIYAPLTRVNMLNAGQLFGTAVAGSLTLSGTSGVHYDTLVKPYWANVWDALP